MNMSSPRVSASLFCALVFLSVAPANAAPGDLDPTFAAAGTVHFGFGGASDSLNDAALAPDGKIVVAGHSQVNGDGVWTVARYLVDGSLDPSFGGTGVVLTNVGAQVGSGGGMDSAEGVRLQADGKIVVAGTAGGPFFDVQRDFAIARYQPDGSIDYSFGEGGVTRTDLTGNADLVTALVAQPDGKFVVAGIAQGRLAAVRYHADGSLDTGFGDNGKVIFTGLAATFGNMKTAALTLQADGKMVLATSPVSIGAFILARLNANGSIDSTFGNNGAVAIGMANGVCYFRGHSGKQHRFNGSNCSGGHFIECRAVRVHRDALEPGRDAGLLVWLRRHTNHGCQSNQRHCVLQRRPGGCGRTYESQDLSRRER